MKRKTSFCITVFFIAIAATVFIYSCSSGLAEEDEFGRYSAQEKKELEGIAEEYGLLLEIDDTYFGKKVTKEKIEHLCRDLSELLGTYEIIGEKKGDRIEFVAMSKKLLRSVNAELPSQELIWTSNSINSPYTFSIFLYQNEMSGNISLGVEAEHQELGYAYVSLSTTTIQHIGFQISFSTTAMLTFSTSEAFYFEISGRYYETSKTGELNIISLNNSF